MKWTAHGENACSGRDAACRLAVALRHGRRAGNGAFAFIGRGRVSCVAPKKHRLRPPKDGIPTIEKPQYTSAAEADKWLLPEVVVFGIEYAGLVAAYPQWILAWHEIANEMVGDENPSPTVL